MAPNTSKFVQKMWECAKWACHKWNYDKRSKAAALEVGDTVPVHVAAFEDHHKIQDWWENREYVVEKWPYPNVPVYMVHPRDREGCSQTVHRNYLLPISCNIEKDDKDAPMAGVENMSTSTPVPPVDSEPADAGLSWMVMSSAAGNTPQGSPDQSAPLRCTTQTTWNWLPLRYQNFGLLADTTPSGIWDALVGLHISLHVISSCTPFSGEVQHEYILLIPSHVCLAPLILILMGIPSM